jgi:hypothetical protein
MTKVRVELHGKWDRVSGQLLIEGQSLLERLEEAEGLLYVCRAGVEAALDAIWACGQRGESLDDARLINARLACVTAVHQGAAIVQTAYALGGAAATRRAGVLQHSVPASVFKTCTVRFDNNTYSVMATAIGRHVDVHAYADRIVIRQDGVAGGFGDEICNGLTGREGRSVCRAASRRRSGLQLGPRWRRRHRSGRNRCSSASGRRRCSWSGPPPSGHP